MSDPRDIDTRELEDADYAEPPRTGEYSTAEYPAAEEPQDEEDYSRAGRGLGFTAAALILSFALIGWGFYWLREIVERGTVDQFLYAYQDVSLLPERPQESLQRAGSDKSLRVFYTYDGRSLTPYVLSTRRIPTPPEKARMIVDQLMAPPKSGVYRSALPAGTKVRGFYTIDSTAYLDLSEEFLQPAENSPRAERLAVYSIVNSLTLSDAGVNAVQLLVAGRPIETAWGWIDCSSPLGPNLALIR